MEDGPPKVLVHIVTFNNETSIVPCLESVLSQDSLEPWHNIYLQVTDNNSSDNTVSAIEKSFSGHVRLIKNKINVGFARAHNEALRTAEEKGADYVFILNPDVRLEANALRTLIEALTFDTRAGCACPKLLRADELLNPVTPERFDSTGIRMTPNIRHFDRDSNELDIGLRNRPEYVFGGTGAALLARMNFVRDVALSESPTEIELFDNEFFAYREDADLAWRSQILGWKCRYVPEAVGYHQRKVFPDNRSEVNKLINRCSVRNRFLLQINNFSWRANAHCFLPTLFRNIIVIAAACTIERSSFPALLEVFRKLPRALDNRYRIQRKRRVSELELAQWFSKQPPLVPALAFEPTLPRISSTTVVVVNFNSDKRLRRCLEILLDSSKEKHSSLAVVVVDNNSADESVTIAKQFTSDNPQVTFLELKENLGFAGAINKAAVSTNADSILILNPDIEISQHSINLLCDALSRHVNLGAISPLLTDETGIPQFGFSPRRFPSLMSTLCELFFIHRLWPSNPWTRHYKLLDNSFVERYLYKSEHGNSLPYENPELPLIVEQPAGAALLVRSSAFRLIGGFDSQFWPAWFEDVDFCKRLSKAGFASAVYAHASAIHEGGYSVKNISLSTFANAWYPNMYRYWKKNGSPFEFAILRTLMPIALLLRALISFLDGFLPKKREHAAEHEKLALAKSLLRLAVSSKGPVGK